MGMQMQENQIVADDDDEAGADNDVVARGMEMRDNEIVADDVQAS